MLKSFVSSLGLFVLVLGYSSHVEAYTINSTEKGRQIRWSTEVVALRIDDSFLAMLSPGESYGALAMALDAWRGYPGVPDILINEGAASAPGHHGERATNTVHLLEDWPYEADKLAVTVLTYEVDTGRLLDADILVNGDVDYAVLAEGDRDQPTSGTYDLAAVLTHEAGHVLGLGESDADESATMWPYAHPGDTHQRTLSGDDEAGVMTAYSGPAPLAAGGCGQANVSSRHARVTTTLWALLPLCLFGLRRLRRRSRTLRSVATPLAGRGKVRLAAGAAVLCAAGGAALWAACAATPAAGEDQSAARVAAVQAISDLSDPTQFAALHDAMYDSAPEVRAAVAVQLARIGHRRQRQWAEHLRGDDEAEVRRAAVVALETLTTAPPSIAERPAMQDASIPHPIHGRLQALVVERDQLHIGRARRVGVEREQGLLWTVYRVTAADGQVHDLRVPGGSDGHIAQRVGQEPLPGDGAEIAIMPGAHGQQAWTYHREGSLYGGALGDDVMHL